MRKFLGKSFALASILVCAAAITSHSAPFELKVRKVQADFDGMLMDILYFPSGDNVVIFAQPPNWTMLNGENEISIKDSKVAGANIEVTFRGPFNSKNPKELENELVSDAIGDLYAEGSPEVKFEPVKLINRPEVEAYSVALTHNKYGKVTTRGVLYAKLTDQDVLKVKVGVPPENIEASMKAVKRWVSSFKQETREKLEKWVKEGYKP